jgi:excinuclease ABC subunit C
MEKLHIPKNIPLTPGVYFFSDIKNEILYIGKATSLRQRIRSYFDSHINEKRSSLIAQMVAEATSVTWTETDSVLEAMLLETNLIRIHKPYYNTRSKDDKSFNHVVITDEDFPRILVVRGKDLGREDEPTYRHVFGPFPSGVLFKEALTIIRKIFKLYNTKKPLNQIKSRLEKGKIDFNRQIGLYPHEQSKESYNRTVRHVVLLFEGKKAALLKHVEEEMLLCAKEEKFEEAQELRDRLFALKHIQDVALVKDESRTYRDERTMRIESYDIAHLHGDDMVGVMTVFYGDEPRKSEYRKFKIHGFRKAHDPGALKEVLGRRLIHTEWAHPDLIVVDGGTIQCNAMKQVLREHSLSIPVVGVVKDERHKPVRLIGAKKILDLHRQAILFSNAEAHRFAIQYHRTLRSKNMKK